MTDNPPFLEGEGTMGDSVRAAYLATPGPSPDAIARAIAAARDAVDVPVLPRHSLRAQIWWGSGMLLAASVAGIWWLAARPHHDAPEHRIARVTPTESSAVATTDSVTVPRAIPPGVTGPAPLPRVASPVMTMTRGASDSASAPAPLVTASTAPVIVPWLSALDAESRATIGALLDSLRARHLPIAPVQSRVMQGVRQGVPAPRIVAVARTTAAAVGDARSALGPRASAVEVQTGAEALLAGASVSTLQSVRAARPDGSVAEPLLALTDLAAHGVEPVRAGAAISALMARPSSDAAIGALRTAVIGAIVKGSAPDAAFALGMRRMGDLPAPSVPPPPRGRSDSLVPPGVPTGGRTP